MRTKDRQRVCCEGCGWSGGRADGGPMLLAPCGKCGGSVVLVGASYQEVRVLAGCNGCSWWGERPPTRLQAPCPKCGRPTEAVHVVTLSGTVVG